jgi:hypothetical protein
MYANRNKQTQIYTHGRRDDCTDRHTDTDKRKYAQTCTERLTHAQARKTQTHRFITDKSTQPDTVTHS